MVLTADLKLFADYFQIYLADPSEDEDFADAWNEASALRDRLIVRRRILGVATGRNMTVPVRVTSHDAPPDLSDELVTADHAVQAGIYTASGKLVVAGCSEYVPDAFALNLRQGPYGAAFLSFQLSTVNHLDGQDRYELHVWPAAEILKPQVLVRWGGG